MLEAIIVVVLLLWLLGFLGPGVFPVIPAVGGVIHILLFVVVVLIIVRLAGR